MRRDGDGQPEQNNLSKITDSCLRLHAHIHITHTTHIYIYLEQTHLSSFETSRVSDFYDESEVTHTHTHAAPFIYSLAMVISSVIYFVDMCTYLYVFVFVVCGKCQNILRLCI